MPTNPDPARITDAIWIFWEESQKIIPDVRLGGIFADKVCYHNTVTTNLAKWPNAYCIKLDLDLTGPRDKARAIDLTMGPDEMSKRTGYLQRAALHPDDDRLNSIREFYGTLNGTVVYGLIHTGVGDWETSTADSTHLWHIHLSFFTKFCADWSALRPVLSVLAGLTWEEWLEQESTMTVYFVIESNDVLWNGLKFVSNGIHRRQIRKPGGIQRPALELTGYRKITLTDALRQSVSATETWDNYLDAVAGPEIPEIQIPSVGDHTHDIGGPIPI